MNPEFRNTLARKVALGSFISGTILFALYYYSNSTFLVFIAYFFLIGVGILNLIVLLTVFVNVFNNKYRRKAIHIIGVMFLNIPIAIIYVYIVTILLGTIRLRVINKTGNTLSNIEISGCENESISSLRPNESKLFWISIPHDCSVQLSYINNGISKDETIIGYATNGGGHRATFRIGVDFKAEYLTGKIEAANKWPYTMPFSSWNLPAIADTFESCGNCVRL